MMPVVLPNDSLRLQFPQARIMIRACRDQVRRVRAERAIPDPTLVGSEIGLKWKRDGLVGVGVRFGLDAPNTGAMI